MICCKFEINLHASDSGRTVTQEIQVCAFGIPEFMSPIWRRAFMVNLHAPGSGRNATQEIQACIFGIPKFMPHNRRRDFYSKPAWAWQRMYHYTRNSGVRIWHS